jgi:hypothetical protein
MAELPRSLSIALWLVGSIWLVAIIGHLVGAPRDIVYAAFITGVFAGIAEWIAFARHRR